MTKPNIWTVHGEGNPVSYQATTPDIPDAPKASTDFAGIEFTGKYANYTKADTWYPSWASDGKLYSPWTDGSIADTRLWSGAGEDSGVGYAEISGDDPMNLEVANWGIIRASAAPFQGRYPCGSLVHNGIWYHGTYSLDQPVQEVKSKYGWYVLGPCVGFHWTDDYGKTWHQSPCTPASPLFDEAPRDELDLAEGKQGPFTKMGAPHFVDFGKNMAHSPDGKAYLVGHGAEHPDPQPRIANNSWVTGDAVFHVHHRRTPRQHQPGRVHQLHPGVREPDRPLATARPHARFRPAGLLPEHPHQVHLRRRRNHVAVLLRQLHER